MPLATERDEGKMGEMSVGWGGGVCGEKAIKIITEPKENSGRQESLVR